MKKLLITGCGRSGTEYIATVLQKLGIDTPHEHMGKDGVVDWSFASNKESGIAGFTANDFEIVLHQVREPMCVMRSAFTLSKKSWQFIFRNSPVNACDHPIVQVGQYWYYWNKQAENLSQWTYRVEDLLEIFSKFCEKVQVVSNKSILQTVPTDINSRCKFTGTRHKHYRVFSWNELYNQDPHLTENIFVLAEHYGYNMQQAQEAL